MIKSLQKTFPIYIFIDFILILSALCLSYLFKYNSFTGITANINFPNVKEYFFIFCLWSLFIIILFGRSGLYATNRNLTIPKEMLRVVVSLFYVAILMSAIIFFAQYKFFSRQIFIINFISLCVLLSGWRIIKRLILRRLIAGGYHNINVLVVGAGRMGKIIQEEIRRFPWWGFKIIGFLDDNVKESIEGVPVLGVLDEFIAVAKKYFVSELIITIPSEKQVVSRLIRQAKKMHLGVRIIPEKFEEPLPALDINYLGVIPLITYKERAHYPIEFALKRAQDFIVSLVVLIVFLPLFIIIAVLVKISSSGPVFYVQKRAGFKGKPFNLYKFRSMIKDADKLKDGLLHKNEVKDGVIFKIKLDPRIVSFGRFLRRFSLDELPQLFNVLKGDMSLVGPRPPTLDEVEKYNHFQMERLSVRPGMTGLSQVRGRSELSFRRWIKWDLWYVNNWSFGLDFLILRWTIPVVFKGKGAY